MGISFEGGPIHYCGWYGQHHSFPIRVSVLTTRWPRMAFVKHPANLATVVFLCSLPLAANSVNPPLSFTGGFEEPNCTQCHTGTVNSAGGKVMILGVPAVYTPGSTLPIQ